MISLSKKRIFSLLIILLILSLTLLYKTKQPVKLEAGSYILSLASCRGKQYNACLESQAKDLLSKYSFSELINVYDKEFADKPNACHDIMHHIAGLEYNHDKNLPQLFTECTSVCSSACYHGVVLGYMESRHLETASPGAIFNTLKNTCDTLTGEKAIFKPDCLHGIGHSLMLISLNNLPFSLKTCDKFTQPEFCYGGVFMENFPISSSSDEPSEYIRKDDPYYPCNSLESKYSDDCYILLTAAYIRKVRLNQKEIINFCEGIKDKDKNMCYWALGGTIIWYTQDISAMADVCYAVPEYKSIKTCIQGVANSFYEMLKGTQDDTSGMFAFCSQVKDRYKNDCYSRIGENLKREKKKPSDIENLCGKIEQNYKDYCLGKKAIRVE